MNKQVIKSRIKQSLKGYHQVNNICRVSLFGSQLTKPRQKSDVDLLVEFTKPVGFFEMARLQQKLEEKLQKKVDIVTPAALSKYFRKDVIDSSELVYEK